jgi:hypothetical protein
MTRMPMNSPDPASTGIRGALVAGVVVMMLVLVARWAYLAWYGSPLPFYDQWDAEGDRLLKPWLDGTFRFGMLFDPHNEHRITWSRLLSLAVFESTGRWNNLDLARVSAAFAALASGALAAMAWRGLDGALPRVSVLVLVLALGVSPASWENILVGFQSQFYFLVLFGGLTIASASLSTGGRGYASTAAFGVASLFTMASGLIALIAAAATQLVVMVERRQIRWLGLSLAALLFALAIASYRAVPEILPHQALRAQNLGDLISAASVALSWPFVGMPWMTVVLWSPFVATSLLALKGHRLGRLDHAAWGLALFAFGQALAMAYSRGAGMEQVSSRYADLLSVGLFANAFLAFRVASVFRQRPRRARIATSLAAVFCLGLVAAIVKRADNDLGAMASRSAQTCTNERVIRGFFEGGGPDAIPASSGSLPYPNRDRLLYLLADPTLNGLVAALNNNQTQRRCPVSLGGEIISGPNVVELGNVGNDGQPVALTSGTEVSLHFVAPESGELQAVGLLVGTYGGLADGQLDARVCADANCQTAEEPIDEAKDNAPLMIRMPRSLHLQQGTRVTVDLRTTDATHPIAIWTYPATGAPALAVVGSESRSAAGVLVFAEPSTQPED